LGWPGGRQVLIRILPKLNSPGIVRGFFVHIEDAADVRTGSNSEVGGRNHEVRFTPESRHNSDIAACPFGADFVAKVENRTTLKISRKSNFGLLRSCFGFQ
jgi:hypothetical protein